MLAISQFPIKVAEPMAKMVLKEAQGLWMAWINTLEPLTEEKHFASLKEPLPPLPKLIGAAPSGTSESLISLTGLTLNMADLTLDSSVSKKTG
ncbi:hypothetical protein Tco_0474903 [Tanacetum coccineum]